MPTPVIVWASPCGGLYTSVIFHVAVCMPPMASATSANARLPPPPGTNHDINASKAIKIVAATAIRVVSFIFLILSISGMR
jgi:hypothetical protein